MLEWDGDFVEVGGHRFYAMIAAAKAFAEDGRPTEVGDDLALRVCKSRRMVNDLIDLLDELQPRRILELGILGGGSAALIASYLPDATIAALDIEPEPPVELEAYLERADARDRLRPFYGVDQSDGDRVRSIIDEVFARESIDLVIDDASHRDELTRASLDTVLPHVRPGGCYVVEDWDWALADYSRWRPEHLAALPGGSGLVGIVQDLVSCVGSATGVFDRVDVRRTSTRAWRGKAVLDPSSFRLAEAFRAGVVLP